MEATEINQSTLRWKLLRSGFKGALVPEVGGSSGLFTSSASSGVSTQNVDEMTTWHCCCIRLQWFGPSCFSQPERNYYCDHIIVFCHYSRNIDSKSAVTLLNFCL